MWRIDELLELLEMPPFSAGAGDPPDETPRLTSASPNSRFQASRPPTRSIGACLRYFLKAFSYIAWTSTERAAFAEQVSLDLSAITMTSNLSRLEKSVRSTWGAIRSESSMASPVVLQGS